MIDGEHWLSVKCQCRLLDLNRSTVYYRMVPVSGEDLELMRLIRRDPSEAPVFGQSPDS
jgi:putative transposase